VTDMLLNKVQQDLECPRHAHRNDLVYTTCMARSCASCVSASHTDMQEYIHDRWSHGLVLRLVYSVHVGGGNEHVPAYTTLRETGPSLGARCTWGWTSCTRGSLPQVQLSGKRVRGSAPRGSRLPREPEIAHSGKASPRGVKALGDEILFFQKTIPKNSTVAPSGRPPATAPSSAVVAAVDPALSLLSASAPSTPKEVAVVGGRHHRCLVP
jgi:hypothetical protein